MRREIFVFSGTGNSLAVAKGLAAILGDCELVSIPGALRGGSPATSAPSVGLVFPLYFFGPPRVVLEFIRKVDLRGVTSLFAVVTRGGTPGCAAHLIRKTLRERTEVSDVSVGGGVPGLDGVFYITFWTNFIARHWAPSEKRREAIARRGDAKLLRIARAVEAGKTRRRREFFYLLGTFLHRRFLAKVNSSDTRFFATDRCSSCGLCARICPVSNIRMEGGRPSWLHRCELCLACLHFCPETAIEYGARTVGKRRCRHPRVRAEDLVEMKNKVRMTV
jgi:Pyruvate/2-oxoacid:ferredoxin oxidoreductase delta subunit